jgi:hypothetical protein
MDRGVMKKYNLADFLACETADNRKIRLFTSWNTMELRSTVSVFLSIARRSEGRMQDS